MSWAHLVRDTDRALFKQCRRAWDLGARMRRNLEPAAPRPVLDVGRAIRDALAVYYFPGMWEWDRQIVQSLAVQAFLKSVQSQRLTREGTASPRPDDAWDQTVEHGQQLLDVYFEWASAIDVFTPVRVETDFQVDIPDPDQPDRDLAAADGRPIRYQGRIDMLVVDPDDVYWLVAHRVADDDFAELETLLLDERSTTACWAWELFFIGMRIAGVFYNEMLVRPDSGPVIAGGRPRSGHAVPGGHRRMYAQAAREPDQRVEQTGTDVFRRTRVARSRAELDQTSRQLAREVLDMTASDLALYPHPTRENCSPCAYRDPCLAMNEGRDPADLLTAGFRVRDPELEEGRLGGVTWSMNRGAAPPRFGRDRNR